MTPADERALRQLRRGPTAKLRETVRQMLLRLIGYGYDELSKFPPGHIPSQEAHYKAIDYLPLDEAIDLATVAHDALVELEYDAAADYVRESLADARRGWAHLAMSHGALDALTNLESGPPSMRLGNRLVLKQPMHHVHRENRRGRPSRQGRVEDYIIARSVFKTSATPWFVFAVGVPIRDVNGNQIAWDPDGGFTFRGEYRTLTEARAAT